MSSPNVFRRKILFTALLATPLTAAALLPPWLQHIRANAAFESALYRMMALPGASVFFPRPPKESIAELNKLPETPALYSLRAHQEEQALDFPAAEADWKSYAAKSPDHSAALVELANFYHRRLAVNLELTTLLEVANSPAVASEDFITPANQRSWQAFERALTLCNQQSLDEATILALYKSWIVRYPQQPTVHARAFTWALDQRRYPDAEAILAQYRGAFASDQVFPIKASALLALRRGDATKALTVYDTAFQPLWPDALVNSYFALLDTTHNLRHFLADADVRLQRNPDDLNALGRIFLYDQHQSQTAAALAALDRYRRSKAARNAPWSATELNTLAQLSLAAHDAPDAARYDFALYSMTGNLPDGRTAKEAGLGNMISLLLSTPAQPITLGAGNLSMYRDIATLDQEPGYWNGILSLWFNGQSPSSEFAAEERKAQPYFQRAKAAELLALLDREAPNASQRPAFHAQLLQVYVEYGDNAAVIHEGSSLLAQFPNADSAFRLSVAMTMADAYARQNDTASEFALYDRTLAELSARSKNMPLTAASLSHRASSTTDGNDGNPSQSSGTKPDLTLLFQLDSGAPTPPPHSDADAYVQVLDRYIGRLTSAQQIPQALAVLRKELDRNPNDPLIYEKLANFLAQNKLSAGQEEVYRAAIAKFQDATWTDKLARYYLKQKRFADYSALTRKVADTFEGTDLERYFRQAVPSDGDLEVQLNLYAHERFPHDVVFTENLLRAYRAKNTANPAAWDKLIHETWWQTPELTRQFFELLSLNGKLDAELAQLRPWTANPAAQQEAAQAALWRSHFEQSAPLFAELSASYPADIAIGTTASDLQRSLAWFDPARTAASVAIEQRLLAANPGDLGRLARIGDILADHADDTAASLAPAAQYWRRMPTTAPGDRNTYLQAATIFWDYFQFDDALAQLTAARTHFHEPALYGYEAGAIAEGKRDYPLAVREYVAAALDSSTQDSEAESRLLQLARRSSTRDLVDRASAAAASDSSGLTLRLKVLSAQHRNTDAAPLLEAALKKTKTADDAAAVGAIARDHNLNSIYTEALVRQADLTTDSVERLQLRYALARAYEDRNDLADASRLIDTLYKENPLVLGVVRSTVDFDWRNKRQPQAINVLVAAARAAQPELAGQFTAEAAAKANESGDTKQAQTLAESLLQTDPYNAQYLSLAADSYVRANNNAGLKQFYLARLDALRTTTVDPDTRKARTALLRRGLIPALTRAKDYEGAVDQYIALISAYPEDSDVNNEAALYALRYDRKQRLIDFFQTTNKSSPLDSRFFIDLAQAQTVFSDLPAAIDAYTHAIAIRKDRAELYTAKAALEETLQRLDDAAADYQRLYVLSYKDPQWMIAIARVRARQGRAADAASALKTAYLTGPKQHPRDYFLVASQLEQWNFLDDAARFAEQGRAAAGERFLSADPAVESDSDPVTYVRILTRLHRTGTAFTALREALTAANVSPSSPPLIVAQAQSQGVASVTDSKWRQEQAVLRKVQAEAAFARAVVAIGTTVDTYYTPEERTAFAAELDQQSATANLKQLTQIWIPAAHAAGLLDKEAAQRRRLVILPGDVGIEQLPLYVDLERSRMKYAELGQTVEAFIKAHPVLIEMGVTQAADAYHSAGDIPSELRVLRTQNLRDNAQIVLRDRYLDLLLHNDTAALIAVAGTRNDSFADAAANLALQKATPAVAFAAIQSRGRALPAIWIPATTGLAQLFFADTTGKGDASLRSILLADATIAERLASKPNTSKQLVGELWFYYAAREGQLRLLAPTTRDSAEDVLAADLEHSANARTYAALAQTYAEAGNTAAALAELDHVLELDPNAADAHDARALILWNAGRKDEAVAAWRAALAALRVIEDRSAAPETFWTAFIRIAHRLHERNLFVQTRPQMDDVLRIYLARNGNYRSNELLKAAFRAAPTAAEGTDWILSLASAAVDPLTVLTEAESSAWLPPSARETVLLREIELAEAAVPADAASSDYSRTRLLTTRVTLIKLYATQHQDARALALLRSIDTAQRNTPELQQLDVVLAARSGQLDALLAGYRSHPDSAPDASVLHAAAAQLAAENQLAPARTLLEFAFDRSIAAHSLASTDYLALADVRLRTNDLGGAVALLRSLVQTAGDTYANLDSAAALLEKTSHPVEAIPFLATLARSTPWDSSYSVRLAEARQHAKQSEPESVAALTAIARNPQVPYVLRTRAARDLSGSTPAANLGSAELNLLASASVSPTASQQPFFFAARVAAASQSHDAKQQATLLREAIAVQPNGPSTAQILLDLFHAELHTSNIVGTRSALDALLNAPVYRPPNANEDADDILPETYDADPNLNGTDLPAAANTLPAPQRLALALEIADILRRTGDSARTLDYFRLARRLAPTDAEKVPILEKIAAIQAEQRLEVANVARRPVIHKTLDQALIVRSRLNVAPNEVTAPSTEEE